MRFAPIAASITAFGSIVYLALFGLIPYLPIAAFAILFTRAIIGLSPYRRRVKAIRIGIWEVVYGVIVVISAAVGWNFGL